MSRERFTENPFYVLGLRPDCSRGDLEREGQKLLAMLELGMAAAKTYPTPLGPAQRTADRVRQAMAELRDPRRRLRHELWAQLPAGPPEAQAGPGPAPSATPEDRPAVEPGSTAAPQAAPGPVPGAAPEAHPAAEPESAAASGPPPPWPAARALFGFGARR